MTHIHSEWLKREQRLWSRNDAPRWLRPDHKRFERPAQFERKYNPSQPRVPSGNSDGGQWTSGGSSSPTNGLDGLGAGLEAFAQLAFLQTLGPVVQGVRAIALGIEAVLTTFTALSARNGIDGTAAAIFRSAEFQPGVDPRAAVGWFAWLSPEQLERACPAQGLVQSMTDMAAARVDRDSYTAQGYGTAVHWTLKNDIEALFNPNLRSEVSVLKTREETGAGIGKNSDVNYGTRGSIRIDVLENAGNNTICVYDIKTGKSSLSVPRMREIAQTVSLNFPGTARIIVTEIRPRK